SPHTVAPFFFQSTYYKRTPAPVRLQKKGQEMFGVVSYKGSGVDIKVTNLERTLVDMIDRPHLTGSWEQIWRSLESIESCDLNQVVEYVHLLENATTAARVGFFLEQHRETLNVRETHLNLLQKLCPRQPHYLMRSKRNGCKMLSRWNLLVPPEMINRTRIEGLSLSPTDVTEISDDTNRS
ncbi:hypothetical protein LLG10_05815, partial [bacterium]|nr:hypothetical protein [bacterium]